MSKVMLASGNQGKLAELSSYLKPLNFELVLQPKDYGEIEETGLTFVENALLKAQHAAKLSGLASIADDSGLVVEALNGAPGVKTARFAGEQATSASNMDKLLKSLENYSEMQQRKAKFVCVLVYLRHHSDPTPIIAKGEWHGCIGHEKKGSNGFGYDPIFYGEGMSQTAAEMSLQMKSQFSHRAFACKNLLRKMS